MNDRKKSFARIIAIVIAGIMALSVVLTIILGH